MNKALLATLVAVPVAAAYPAASWYLGQQVESALADQYKALENIPYLKVIERKYERKLFDATEVVTFEVMGEMARALEKSRKESAEADPSQAKEGQTPIEPLRFTVSSQIQHGPLAGFKTPAAAVQDSELVFSDQTKKEIAKIIGDKKPLTVHTVYRFDGGGVTELTSPAFSATPDGQTGKIAWEGFKATVNFAKRMQTYSYTAEAPRLDIDDGKGFKATVTDVKMDGNQKRIYDDEPMLYSGTQRFFIAKIDSADADTTKPQISIEKFVYDVNLPSNGDFLDILAKMAVDTLKVNGQNFGPAHYDFSAKHLHARTVASLYRNMMKLYSDPSFATGEGDTEAMAKAMMEPMKALLSFNPELSIDRISFNTGNGEAVVSANAKLKDAKPEEIDNPMLLLGKLEANAEASVPELFLAKAEDGALLENGTKMTPEMEAQLLAGLDKELAGFASQGYIERSNGVVKSKVAFRNGQLTVNGKPFALGGMPGAVGAGK